MNGDPVLAAIEQLAVDISVVSVALAKLVARVERLQALDAVVHDQREHIAALHQVVRDQADRIEQLWNNSKH